MILVPFRHLGMLIPTPSIEDGCILTEICDRVHKLQKVDVIVASCMNCSRRHEWLIQMSVQPLHSLCVIVSNRVFNRCIRHSNECFASSNIITLR